MKETSATPLFRNCPNAEIFKSDFDSDCRNCVLYEECIERKAERIERRRKNRRKSKIKFLKFNSRFILIDVLLILLVLIIICKTSKGKSNEFTIKTIQYDETIETMQTSSDINIKENELITSNTSEERKISISREEQATKAKVQSVIVATPLSNESENADNNSNVATISAYEPGEVYYYNISADSEKLIEKLVYQEARGELYEGKVAVAAVVLNRYCSGDSRFERDSIYTVIAQRGAFAPIEDVTQSMLDEVPELAKAVDDACRGWDPTRKVFENGALFFYAPDEVYGYQKEIREGIEILKIGNHNFHVDLND